MPVVRVLVLLFFAYLVPFGMGAGFACLTGKENAHKTKENPVFIWVTGYVFYLAVFQLLAVPCVLLMRPFTELVWLYGAVSVVLSAVGFFLWQKNRSGIRRLPGKNLQTLLWGLVLAGIAAQLVLSLFTAFEDGDDAYYVTAATLAVTENKMYRFLPYTGGASPLDFRHCLAPYPMWIAFLSKTSGIHPAIVAHSFIPFVMLPLAYGIYGMIGSRLLKKQKKYLPVYMLFTELLVVWGNYSVYTAETFLMIRSRQGKAVLASVVLPMLLFVLFFIGECCRDGIKIRFSLWLLLTAAIITAALCSIQGNFLACLLTAVGGGMLALGYRRWKMAGIMTLCMLPALFYLAVYVLCR